MTFPRVSEIPTGDGGQGGIFALGPPYADEQEKDIYIRVNYMYLGGVADYSLFSKGVNDIFIRAGITPARQCDFYVRHKEYKFAVLGIAGIGYDLIFNRFMLTFYLSHKGIPTFLFSYGLYFGKRRAAKNNTVSY